VETLMTGLAGLRGNGFESVRRREGKRRHCAYKQSSFTMSSITFMIAGRQTSERSPQADE